MTDNPPYRTALNELMGECFRLNRSYLEVSARLTDGSAVTGAQWGVLAALGQSDVPGTVAATARRMGLARQSVQRVADLLADAGLICYLANPDDKRAKLVEVTTAGKQELAELKNRQHAWVDGVVGEYGEAEIRSALQVIKNIRERVSQQGI